MKIINRLLYIVLLSLILVGCGWFDDAKEIAKQLEYYKKYSKSLEDKINGLNATIDRLKKENYDLEKILQTYKDAHKRMMQ